MANWKTWTPFQSKKQKDVVDHLTTYEKDRIVALSKECGKKLGFSFLPSLIILFILVEIYHIDSYIPVLIVIWLANILFSIKFISLPYKEKQKAVLNNSEYAIKNELTV